MHSLVRHAGRLLLSAALVTAPASAQARFWSGFVTANGQQIPIEVQIGKPAANGRVTGAFVNGPELEQASSGTLTGEHLVLNFAAYARRLEGDLTATGFHGAFAGARLKQPLPVELHPEPNRKPASRFVAAPATQTSSIEGNWEIAVESSKGEHAWTLHIDPAGGNGRIRAVIQRVDGDTGALYGGLDPATGEYRISRFGAFGRDFYSLKPQADGTLLFRNLLQANETDHVARRTDIARAAKLPPPTAPTEATSVSDPTQPFHFSAPNLAGATVTNADAQFRGKVVIVAVGGSWCVNCHDEAPFLVKLYQRFHTQGLEIVDLSFEEDDQLKDPQRLRQFVTDYHIPYTVLVGGTPDDVHKALPQAKDLNSWPTTFFVGRDGLVKQVHAGYSGPATGAAGVQLQAEVTALVQKLLSERPQAPATPAGAQ